MKIPSEQLLYMLKKYKVLCCHSLAEKLRIDVSKASHSLMSLYGGKNLVQRTKGTCSISSVEHFIFSLDGNNTESYKSPKV